MPFPTNSAIRRAAVCAVSLLTCNQCLIAQDSPEDSLETLQPADGIEVSLWASEPMVNNPTAMDIDSRGRVWIAEGLNYRMQQKQFDTLKRVDGADRIKILTDTDGDGRADKVTVFADNIFPVPLGLAIEEIWEHGKQTGTRVYVGKSPELLVIEDSDGDDKADRRYPLLTGFRGVDSDHGLHGMTFGPDGKLYFTVGDAKYGADEVQTGEVTFDVTDKSGRRLSASRAGTVLRVDLDGKNLEVLAYGHRNNYEAAVDSFGNVFASDNDDDGDRGCRTTWIMEGGDYGYQNANSSRHWAEELPGIIPKIVGTGNGAPGGLTVYEGSLLPTEFAYSLIQVDSGAHQVNVHPLKRFGAGFRSDYHVLLKGDDSWFRPVDVSVAPDGSVFVCDWYDATVGGSRFSDQDTGRVYRLSSGVHRIRPSSTPPDFGHIDGLIASIRSPNAATRFAARQLLIAAGADARPALLELLRDGRPNERARALFVLAALPRTGRRDVIAALKNADPRLRETALQILAQDATRESVVEPDSARNAEPPAVAVQSDILPLVNDPDAGVRRALLMAIRNGSTVQFSGALNRLAESWDGRDRYYLEALRGALVDREADFVRSLFNHLAERATCGGWDNQPVALSPFYPTITNDAFLRPGDEMPRSNAASSMLGLAWALERAEALPAIRRVLKANDSESVERAADLALSRMDIRAGELMVERLAASADDPPRIRELLRRIEIGIGGPWRDLSGSAALRKSVTSSLQRPELRAAACRAIGKCRLSGFSEELTALSNNTLISLEDRAAAIEALGDLKHEPVRDLATNLVRRSRGEEHGDALALAALSVLAKFGGEQAALQPILSDDAFPPDVRRRVLQLMVRYSRGAERLIVLRQEGKLPQDLESEFAFQIHNHVDRRIRKRAAELFPASKSTQPDIDAALALSGNSDRGRGLFFNNKDIACSRCHRVNQRGDMIGPDLSSIGTKYGRRELLYHIVNPSGAINYSYVGQVVLLDDGRMLTGLVVERSDASITLKTATGETVQIDNDAIEQQHAQKVSLMPDGLASKLEKQQLADLLEFLSTLRQTSTPRKTQ